MRNAAQDIKSDLVLFFGSTAFLQIQAKTSKVDKEGQL